MNYSTSTSTSLRLLRYVCVIIESESELVVSAKLSKMADKKVLCLVIILQALSYCENVIQMNKDEYLKLRNNMLDKEYQMRTGGNMKLTDAELCVNATLMSFKAKELEVGRGNVTDFPPAVHFFRAKSLIDKSEVFKMIRSIPKG